MSRRRCSGFWKQQLLPPRQREIGRTEVKSRQQPVNLEREDRLRHSDERGLPLYSSDSRIGALELWPLRRRRQRGHQVGLRIAARGHGVV